MNPMVKTASPPQLPRHRSARQPVKRQIATQGQRANRRRIVTIAAIPQEVFRHPKRRRMLLKENNQLRSADGDGAIEHLRPLRIRDQLNMQFPAGLCQQDQVRRDAIKKIPPLPK